MGFFTPFNLRRRNRDLNQNSFVLKFFEVTSNEDSMISFLPSWMRLGLLSSNLNAL